MSVYTPLSLQEVQAFALPYGLEVIDLIPIQGGIENTNYFLVANNQQQYVLTVFEELDEQGASELPPVLQHLGQAHVPVAVPLNYEGKFIHRIAQKPAQIAPRIAGEHPIPSNIAQVKSIAVAQASLHLALQNYSLARSNSRNHQFWTAVGESLKPVMSTEDLNLLNQVYVQFDQLREQHPDLPCGWIHSDMFRDNTLFVGDELEGILDFSELNQDDFLFDIAISINDFCTEYPEAYLDHDKVQAFVDAYQSVRGLTQDEQACLPIYLAMAACRFWLMRLQVAQRNVQEGRIGNDIMQKNPLEMRNMLVDRLQAMAK